MDNSTKYMFKETGIYHLVALSGSNIVIILWLLRIFKSKASISYLTLISVILTFYFIYTNYIHPLARATIFMIISELYRLSGIKASSLKRLVVFAVSSLYLYLWSEFSISMFLSIYFSLAIILFNLIKERFFRNFSSIFIHIFFSCHISIFSIPIYIFIFNDSYKTIYFLSNLIIVPVYEIFLYFFYISYILALSGLISYAPDFLLSFQNLLFNGIYWYFKLFII